MSRITLMYLKNPWILTNWCNFLFLVIYSITMTFLYHLFALVITTSGWKGVRCLTLKQYSKQKWWFSQPVCKAFCAYSSTDAKKKEKELWIYPFCWECSKISEEKCCIKYLKRNEKIAQGMGVEGLKYGFRKCISFGITLSF